MSVIFRSVKMGTTVTESIADITNVLDDSSDYSLSSAFQKLHSRRRHSKSHRYLLATDQFHLFGIVGDLSITYQESKSLTHYQKGTQNS